MKPGDQVPSENQLAQQHGVSRMTARRALSEMVDEGILLRSQGLGTFVSTVATAMPIALCCWKPAGLTTISPRTWRLMRVMRCFTA